LSANFMGMGHCH